MTATPDPATARQILDSLSPSARQMLIDWETSLEAGDDRDVRELVDAGLLGSDEGEYDGTMSILGRAVAAAGREVSRG